MTNFLVHLRQLALMRRSEPPLNGGPGLDNQGPPPPPETGASEPGPPTPPGGAGANTTIEAPPVRPPRNCEKNGTRAAYPTLPRGRQVEVASTSAAAVVA